LKIGVSAKKKRYLKAYRDLWLRIEDSLERHVNGYSAEEGMTEEEIAEMVKTGESERDWKIVTKEVEEMKKIHFEEFTGFEYNKMRQ
jgi:hypothetical protein